MIEDLAIVEESHLEDPDGAVERRLRMYSRNDVLQIKELEDILATPSPKVSEIVRHWPDAMWNAEHAKRIAPEGSVQFCAIGILAETGGFEWGEPDGVRSNGSRIWYGFSVCDVGRFVGKAHGLSGDDLIDLYMVNDNDGKEAAANWLESRGL